MPPIESVCDHKDGLFSVIPTSENNPFYVLSSNCLQQEPESTSSSSLLAGRGSSSFFFFFSIMSLISFSSTNEDTELNPTIVRIKR